MLSTYSLCSIQGLFEDLISLTADKEDTRLPRPDRDVRKLRDLVLQNDSRNTAWDLLSSICLCEEDN